MRIYHKGSEIEGYQRDQQVEWVEKSGLSGLTHGFKCGGKALGGGEGRYGRWCWRRKLLD
jgi:hypothetical protein